MQKRLLIAGGIAIILIGGMFFLQTAMNLRMEHYLSSGADIPLWERILFGLGSLWGTFWWLLTPLILFLSFGIALMVDVVFRKGS